MSFVIFAFGLLALRTFGLTRDTVRAGYQNASVTLEAETVRGTVYDCGFRPLTNCEYNYFVAAKPTEKALSELKEIIDIRQYETAAQRLSSGHPELIRVEKPGISTDSLTFFSVPRRYSSDSFACHIIGYTDSAGRGVSGVEKAADELLSKNSSDAIARFRADAAGRIMNGTEPEIGGAEVPAGGIVLTVDGDIQQAAENALDFFKVEKGCAVVIDIESGGIRACASRPAFDPSDIAASLKNEDSPFINRAFSAYSVGSVFKTVIFAAASENGMGDSVYECRGSAVHSGVTFNCHKEDGHGLLDLDDALACSCNTYFADLGIKLGAEKIIETAEKFGFGRSVSPAPGIVSAPGNLPDADELDSSAAISNISFGQGALTATPLQICAAMAAIASGGKRVNPYLFEGEMNAAGEFTAYRSYSERKRIISAETAERLKEALKKVVTSGSGKRAASRFVEVAGKTATAQTGRFGADGEIFNAWFSGWFPADEPKYAVTVLKEDGGEGAVSCAPIFRMIAESVTAAGKLS